MDDLRTYSFFGILTNAEGKLLHLSGKFLHPLHLASNWIPFAEKIDFFFCRNIYEFNSTDELFYWSTKVWVYLFEWFLFFSNEGIRILLRSSVNRNIALSDGVPYWQNPFSCNHVGTVFRQTIYNPTRYVRSGGNTLWFTATLSKGSILFLSGFVQWVQKFKYFWRIHIDDHTNN